MNDWDQIWIRKGKENTKDLKLLDGYENTNINPEEVTNKIIENLEINKNDKVLEVGCGAGLLAFYLTGRCKYIGIDLSESIVQKHIDILKNSVLISGANDIPFKDNYFDKSFAFGVFHYFPNKKYAHEAISEMMRTTKGNIFIGDIPLRSHDGSHLLYKKNDFKGIYSPGYYNKDRFNILIRREG